MKAILLLLTLVCSCVSLRSAEPEKKDSPPAKPAPEKKMETITLGAGCFWCAEVILQRIVGVTSVESGYCNGQVKNPTYKQVCQGDTGHAEVVKVIFDPAALPLEKLLHVFFELHDPTTLNRQGNDTGTQYRSGIYYQTDAQKEVAEKVKAEVGKSGKFKNSSVTEIATPDNFPKAEDSPQNYFDENYTKGTGHFGYCNALIVPKLKKMGLLKPEEEKVSKGE